MYVICKEYDPRLCGEWCLHHNRHLLTSACDEEGSCSDCIAESGAIRVATDSGNETVVILSCDRPDKNLFPLVIYEGEEIKKFISTRSAEPTTEDDLLAYFDYLMQQLSLHEVRIATNVRSADEN